jgi:thioredoxin reductase (NADPH)
MTDPVSPVQPALPSQVEQMFPKLKPAHIARIAAHGTERSVAQGEVLVEAGDTVVPFFVVLAGRIEIVRPARAAETLITVHEPGQFTGEVNMISGRRSLVRARAAEAS